MQALDAACAVFGSQQALAAALTGAGPRVTSPAINDWRLRQNVPLERCEPIETLCAAQWQRLSDEERAEIGSPPTVDELMPGVTWHRDAAGRVIGVEKPIKPTPRPRKRNRAAVAAG